MLSTLALSSLHMTLPYTTCVTRTFIPSHATLTEKAQANDHSPFFCMMMQVTTYLKGLLRPPSFLMQFSKHVDVHWLTCTHTHSPTHTTNESYAVHACATVQRTLSVSSLCRHVRTHSLQVCPPSTLPAQPPVYRCAYAPRNDSVCRAALAVHVRARNAVGSNIRSVTATGQKHLPPWPLRTGCSGARRQWTP